MQSNIFISVITTVKNGQKYLIETLDSVRNQSFKEFEHIVVDDGSTDETISILKKYADKYPDYPLILLEPGSLGRGKALNYGVFKAKGNWIAIIDADDIWHPSKLEFQFDIVKNNKIDVLATKTELFKETDTIVFDQFFRSEEMMHVLYFEKKDLIMSNKLSHSSVLMKKTIVNYDQKRSSQFDYELWLRLASEEKKLARLDLCLNFHRIHDKQNFEGKMGKVYRWRSFRLKLNYINILKEFKEFIYIVIKLLFDFIFPRELRLMIKKAFQRD